ncbi:MAG: hypothetical protein ACE5FO_03255 [Parvularculaceae bacterium]
MALSKKALAGDARETPDSMAGARPRRASGAETAAYIDEMVRELESLARARGLEQLGALLRLARAEARLTAEES